MTGSALGTPLAREPEPGAEVPRDLPRLPPPHFVLVRVVPGDVERMVQGTPYVRIRWRREGRDWSGGPVMP